MQYSVVQDASPLQILQLGVEGIPVPVVAFDTALVRWGTDAL